MSRRCYVCSSTDNLVEFHPHNWLCEGCLPAGGHVVHMSNPRGGSLAECDCGWRSQVDGPRPYLVQEVKVRLHWRDVIRRAIEDFDALHGEGAARRELAVGLIAIVALLVNVAGLAAVLGGPHG